MVPADSDRISRVPPYSGVISLQSLISSTGLSPSLAGLSRTVPLQSEVINAVRTPECTHSGLGSFPFARRYSENHSYFLFLQVLRCFSSLRLASSCLCIRHVIHGYDSVWVPPFGYRRLFTCLPLTVAFRCLLRPSSPECA